MGGRTGQSIKRPSQAKEVTPPAPAKSGVVTKEMYKAAGDKYKWTWMVKDGGYNEATIMKYTGGGFSDINGALFTNKMGAADLQYAENLTTALDALPNYSGTTWRGSDGYEPDDYYQKNIGSAIEWRGFLSTSKSREQAESFGMGPLFKIKSKKGKWIEKYSDIPEEQEVLFKPRTKFKVLKVEKGKGRDVVHLEEV